MKTCVKKVYCPACQLLVTCKEEKANSATKIVCSRCKTALWTKDNITWKYEARDVS